MRKLINESGIDLASNFDNRPFIDVFLEPTKLYVKPVLALEVLFEAMNHITSCEGTENISTCIASRYAARIDTTSFPTPKI